MKARTLIGSGPMRRTLEGRELVERALRMCERHRCETVMHVRVRRFRIDLQRDVWWWSPWPVSMLSVSLLRGLLRGGVVYFHGLDLQLVGDRLVVTEVDR